jgi:hypothetical protein
MARRCGLRHAAEVQEAVVPEPTDQTLAFLRWMRRPTLQKVALLEQIRDLPNDRSAR